MTQWKFLKAKEAEWERKKGRKMLGKRGRDVFTVVYHVTVDV